jgi:hypothetical protein
MKRNLALAGAEDIPGNHPIRLFLAAYERETRGMGQSILPDLETMGASVEPAIIDYSILLEPICGEPFLDFRPLNNYRLAPVGFGM